jgi:hypothetical protein
MKVIINNGRRRLGVPSRPALILNPKESAPITDVQIEQLLAQRTASRWLESGVLEIKDSAEAEAPAMVKVAERPKVVRKYKDRDERKPEELPDGVTGEGVETHHLGGGWYCVFVNGFRVTDSNVRKDAAETIASEYEK